MDSLGSVIVDLWIGRQTVTFPSEKLDRDAGGNKFRKNFLDSLVLWVDVKQTDDIMIADTQRTPLNSGVSEMSINKINAVCSDVYGCGILAADPLTALWVAERILNETGSNVFKVISRHRNKFGKGTSFPAFGTELFKSL